MAPERIWAQFQEVPLGPLPPPSPEMTLGPLNLHLVSSSPLLSDSAQPVLPSILKVPLYSDTFSLF